MMIRRTQAKADLLRNVPLFAGLSGRERQRLSRLMDEVDLPAETVIIREGNSGGEFFIVVEGQIQRRGRTITHLGPGEFLGEIALIDKGPRTATAIVVEPSTLLVLASREFHSMLAADPRIENKILRTLAQRVRHLEPAKPQ
jgi:CRP/FNR family cyclic AMP-dependent transcriptional regulator